MAPYVGRPLKRFEDPRLVTGQGSFVDDLRLPGILHAVVLRSPHAHARILSLDAAPARALPGVAAVLTASDIAGAVRDIPPRPTRELEGLQVPEHPVLARDKVCYVGQPVAVVVAQDRYLAMRLAQPIKWIEERWENMLAYHGRGYSAEVEAAARRDGTILGMRFRIIADVGAYFLNSSPGPPVNAAHRVAGPYAIHTMDVECLGVLTNKPPTGPYRGAGGPEGAFFMERTMDLLARELGLDPAEIRRRNFIPPEAFPYATATGLTYDSGNFVPALEQALELADYASVRQAQKSRSVAEPLLGVGLATVVKASGGSGEMKESHALIRVEPTGQVTVYTEVSPHGQGTETTFAQIVADELGVRPEDVQVLHGDTAMLASGQGTFASRGMTLGGSAMYEGLQQARRKMALLAAHLLDCRPEDIGFQDGTLVNESRPEHALTFAEVAAAAQRREQLPPGIEAGLEFPVHFILRDNPFGFGAHVAVVEVDRDTGALHVLRYVAVHDCGWVINSKLL